MAAAIIGASGMFRVVYTQTHIVHTKDYHTKPSKNPSLYCFSEILEL